MQRDYMRKISKEEKIRDETVKKVMGVLSKHFNSLEKTHEKLLGDSFLLGLGMGVTSHCETREEGIAWVKRNFGHQTWFMKLIDESLAKKNICSECNSDNTTGSKFCSNCGSNLRRQQGLL